MRSLIASMRAKYKLKKIYFVHTYIHTYILTYIHTYIRLYSRFFTNLAFDVVTEGAGGRDRVVLEHGFHRLVGSPRRGERASWIQRATHFSTTAVTFTQEEHY